MQSINCRSLALWKGVRFRFGKLPCVVSYRKSTWILTSASGHSECFVDARFARCAASTGQAYNVSYSAIFPAHRRTLSFPAACARRIPGIAAGRRSLLAIRCDGWRGLATPDCAPNQGVVVGEPFLDGRNRWAFPPSPNARLATNGAIQCSSQPITWNWSTRLCISAWNYCQSSCTPSLTNRSKTASDFHDRRTPSTVDPVDCVHRRTFTEIGVGTELLGNVARTVFPK